MRVWMNRGTPRYDSQGGGGSSPPRPPPRHLLGLRGCPSADFGKPLANGLHLPKCGLLFFEVFAEQRRDVVLAHRVGHRHETLVRSDLVVLGPRTRTREERVEDFLRR